MRALGTNILVRALVQDDLVQSRAAAAVLGAGPVFIPVTVILELEWILRSRYGYPAATIVEAIAKLAMLENAMVGEREAVITAAEKMRKGWGFADALHHALASGCDDFVTFDKQLVRRASRDRSTDPPLVAI